MSLETHQLTYRLREKNLIEAISLTFFPGLIYGVMGPNGSGKSTLLKTMTGIWHPTEGAVYWQGKNLLNLPRMHISQTLSLVPQSPLLYFDLTVTEMVRMGRYCHDSTSFQQETELIASALKKVDVWHLRHHFLSQLSGGERQRTYIARALVTEAPVLLLDEPTSHLDLRHQLEIWELLRRLAQQGKTVIVTLHDLLAAQRFCDQVMVLHHGRCAATGTYLSVATPQLLGEIFGVRLQQQSHAFHLEPLPQ